MTGAVFLELWSSRTGAVFVGGPTSGARKFMFKKLPGMTFADNVSARGVVPTAFFVGKVYVRVFAAECARITCRVVRALCE